MVYDILIRTFEDGDWLLGILMWIVTIFIVGLILCGVSWAVEEWEWSNTMSFEVKATLISGKFNASTFQTRSVTTVGTNGGVGIGSVMTGDDEEFITIWDCGKYGRLRADNEQIYRWAAKHSTLFLKERGDEARIVGIKKP